MTTGVCTTCPYCGVGCGVLASADGKGGLAIKGDPDHPANFGRLCSKGSALGETVSLDGRLLEPLVAGQPASWDTALTQVATKFSDTIKKHGPDSVAFYVSGQLLTEDYYVANKLMKGFIGSANIDTNSRLCMASSVAGHKRAFGSDTVPGQYTDLEQANLVVLVGSNLAWCHPVLYQRLIAAKAANPEMRVINIDPRRTATSDMADLHLSIAPGADAALFNLLLAEIAEKGACDPDYLSNHVNGFNDALQAAQQTDRAATGIPPEDLQQFLDLWVNSEKVVTIYSQGVNQSSSGTDKVNAILNCHLATGRIGRPGMGPFSVTGQPNAMGGREVGGLANMLACHLDIENPLHRDAVQSFWKAPSIPTQAGAKAVEMFRDIAKGKIKAVWIMCTNPVVSMPEADAVRTALEKCDFVVVSDLSAQTDTAKLAHVVLPAAGWGEKDGTVTNSERCISRQRAVLPTPGQARPDWKIICDVASKMGWENEFSFPNSAAIFREYAGLSAVAAGLGSAFDISGLKGLSDTDYEQLSPVVWPVRPGRTGGRFFADGGFQTTDRKARMLAIKPQLEHAARSTQFPYRLNTGRIRDQWHTMTRSGKSPRLSQHLSEPFVDLHPTDAQNHAIGPADLVELSNDNGRGIFRARLSDNQRPGEIFVPMHWTSQNASCARVDAMVAANVDPVSGQPASKSSAVSMQRFAADWYGFAVSTEDLFPATGYWAKSRAKGGWRVELAGPKTPTDWLQYAATLFAMPSAVASTFIDQQSGTARIAIFGDGKLRAALFVAPTPVAVARDYLVGHLGQPAGTSILAGKPGADTPDPGATVCSCLNVGINTIMDAIGSKGLTSVDQIGAALGAGTSCGSCRPEIRALLANAHVKEAAE